MIIYSEFKPTYLYIKQHSITGMLYFGKTHKFDPTVYNGSGMHWQRHLAKHGKQHVKTLWYSLFTDQKECTEFALMFSTVFDIVHSPNWANMVFENGVGNGTPGRICSNDTKEKHRINSTGRIFTAESNAKKACHGEKNGMFGVRRVGEKSPHYGHKHSEQTLLIMKEKAKARAKIKIKCPHCTKSVDSANAKRWHFDKCKFLFLSDQKGI